MTGNIYQHYDPLYTNGILYAPVNDMIFSDSPIVSPNLGYYSQPLLNKKFPVTAQNMDKFVSTAKNPNVTPLWKKLLTAGVIVALTVAGLKKFKTNYFNRITNAIKPKNIWGNIKEGYNRTINYCTDKCKSITNFISTKFHKTK